ncbi:MAG TPA: hypothetical protein VLC09_17570, partial [Polyangiaceae bacterium]|nr:hypothetical protein [Polyangiaceae bacterium]
RCFIVDEGAQNGWGVYNLGNRTVTINGVPLPIQGSGSFPSEAGAAPYLIEFSAGDVTFTSWAYF